jgi:hypothetical protein
MHPFQTVFDVSPCTIVTISGRNRSIASVTFSVSAAVPSTTFNVSTWAPVRLAISAMRSLKNPLQMQRTREPFHARFVMAISMAADPGPATPITHFDSV